MERFKFLSREKIEKLPKNSGVYCFKNGREILYIGKATNIRERVKQHLQQPAYRDNLFIKQISKVGFIKTDSEIKALILEANLIKKYQPKYNVIWRDDKNYFYIGITKEDYPRVFLTHQIQNAKYKNQNGKSKLKINYVGPFVDGKALKQTLNLLRKVFPYRSCRVIPNRSCLWYHLNRCPAPCLLKSKIAKEIAPNFLKLKKLSQKNARNLLKLLKEGKNPVLKELKREMKLLAKNRNFEEAAKIRDQIKSLERIIEHSKIFETKETKSRKTEWEKTEKILQKILKTKNKISRIEAYDVSNIQGKQATGSMVTFINGLPDKNFYRRFKIKISGKPNDTAMIKEILGRRFNHPEWGLPDLILIDGGKAQLNTAQKTIHTELYNVISVCPKIVALAKKKNELFIEGQKKPILLKSLSREIFNLILQLRDEAHRFARKYHLKLREIDFLPKSW